MKPFSIKTSIVDGARGSCYLEQGSNKVTVGVHGPRSITKKIDLTSTHGVLNVMAKLPKTMDYRKSKQSDLLHEVEEQNFAARLTDCLQSCLILDRFTQNQIDVNISVIEDGGSALAAAISCCSLAFCDAGLDMYDLCVGISLSPDDQLKNICETNVQTVERFMERIIDDQTNFTIGYLPLYDQVAGCIVKGPFNGETVRMALEIARDLSVSIHAAFRHLLSQELAAADQDVAVQ